MTEPLRSALNHRLTLSRAHSAAYEGDLETAARLLDALDTAGEATADVLDLRARVHAQQGELAEADACWERVLAMQPAEPYATAARDKIARINAGAHLRPRVHSGGAVVIAAAMAGTVLVGGIAWLAAGAAGDRQEQVVSSARLNAEVQRAEALQHRLAELDADRAATAGDRAARLDMLARTLAMPGVRVERGADSVRVLFDTGVFSRSTTIAEDNDEVLVELGRRLAEVNARTTVVGHVVAVPGGRSSGGSAVAYSRAQVATSYLARGGDGTLTGFTLATADQSENPYPDDARNRTVTLVVTPAG